jgi:hypothetical protein
LQEKLLQAQAICTMVLKVVLKLQDPLKLSDQQPQVTVRELAIPLATKKINLQDLDRM